MQMDEVSVLCSLMLSFMFVCFFFVLFSLFFSLFFILFSIAGSMYRVVQTTGPDGKNLLRLLPISKSSGSFVPIVQSSVMPNHSKANISNPVHLTFKTQLANTTAPSSVKIPAFQSPNPGKILLTRTLDKQEGGRAGSEKESLSPKSGAAIQSSCVSVDRLSVQNMAVTSSSNQGKTAYMLVNTKTLPVNVKPSVLPSGHHLQIPADAEVKSVPASFLPSAIQQKILAAAATNMSGGADSTKMPTVICVTPVNTVKTVVPKHLQPICPKPAPEVSKSVIMTAAQKGNGSSPETVTPDGQQCQQTPMKWIVQESPQSPAARLIPVRSSSNMATKILKTLSEMKNIEINSPNILSLCSGGPGGSQTKITPIKDNALVMYNGRVFLLTRRGSDVLSGQVDKQASSSSDALIKKETSKLIDSSAVKKITNKVVNLVLSKNKGMVLSQNDPKPVTNSKHSPPTGFRNDLKPAALLTSSANQQNSTVNQRKSLPLSESISSGMTPVPAVGKQEHPSPNGKEKCHSPKAASAVFPQFKQDCSFSEDWQKVIVKLEEDLTKKRKIKSSPQSDSGKRRRTSVKATTSPSPENTSSSSSLHRDVSPPPVFPQQSISTDLAPSSLGRDLQDDPHPQYSHVTDSSFPVLVSCEGDTSVLEGSFRDDTFPWTPPDLDETIRDEKIKRLKQLLREREAALEEMRRKMQQS
ncbi:ligand-dependent nuclear receptor-interacting factor 1 isoform X3 [Apus apus]|uniref:ligand-dependent nuclear receptor-interacting factor 1 isoform X3 n=1 Tax=Apus apus TaxID=8895 RepID=UPI0021F829DF|nr:ligand-dependent nuclear receptor-interacting factor 1 isoform X3 [Apus apus]